LLLNGFEVVTPIQINVVVRSMPNPADVRAERERLAGCWFVHWWGGNLYCLRLRAGGPNLADAPRTTSTRDCIWLLRARLDDVIASVFEKYAALRYRPFAFLAQKEEIVATAASRAEVTHPLLSGFKIVPKFTLHAKIVEPRDGELKLGLFVEVGMRHEINADLSALEAAGVNLSGLYVLRREIKEGERRLAGRIDRLDRDKVHLGEPTREAILAVASLQLEGSPETFARCLRAMLGPRYDDFRGAVDDIEASFRVGPEFDAVVMKMGDFLRRKSPVGLAQGVKASIGSRLAIGNTIETVSIYTAPPVEYVFDRSGSKRHKYAWPGLQAHGPYDRAAFAKKSPRILILYPDLAEGKVDTFLRALRDGISTLGQGFPNGFAKTFGLINPEFPRCSVRLFGGSDVPVETAYRRAAENFLAKDAAVDAGIVVILDEHSNLPSLENPYLRMKAFFLTLGIPTQQIRLQTINQRPSSLQYSLQNLSVALYAKLNGTPWSVDQDRSISDEIIIGMGVAELSGSRVETRQRFVGITTVFGGDGTYLLGSVSRECTYDRYPETLRESMVAILDEVKQRNGWQPGDTVRVIFHAHKPLKRDEIAEIVFSCTKKIGIAQSLQMAFVTVSHDHPFFLFDPDDPGVPVSKWNPIMKGVFAPERGTIARIGRWTRLVAINSHQLIKRSNSPLPKPLLVNLHQDSTFVDLDYLSEQVLKFTALSSRSTLPASTPVTIYYSVRIAELLARLRQIPDWSATPLSVKLRWSLWFL
jgi:hypothetical protein